MIEIPQQRLGEMAPRPVSELEALHGEQVVASPRMLLEPGRPVTWRGGRTPTSGQQHRVPWEFTVRSTLLPDGRIRLRFDVDPGPTSEPLEFAVELYDGQLVFAPTLLPAREDHILVLVAQPRKVNDRADLERILRSKQEAANAARERSSR